MNIGRFQEITARFASLRIAVLGDYCLDRYLEIDPARAEVSIETGLPVHNVTRVRSQPGAAGTIIQNLSALGVGRLHAVGFCGDDGEGYELRRALAAVPSVELRDFITSADRRTFTYCKPLVVSPGELPVELSRLDSKNWSPTPQPLQHDLATRISALVPDLDAVVVMEQVDHPETGVATPLVRQGLASAASNHPNLILLADSRAGLASYTGFLLKMNLAELSTLVGSPHLLLPADAAPAAAQLAQTKNKPVFVTMAEHGMLGAAPDQPIEQVPAYPLRGPIDVVGAGDAVTATLSAALAAGASLREAMQLAMAAASLVIHQLGTTGTATTPKIAQLHSAH